MNDVQKDAIVSTDGRYRYTLDRWWGNGPRVLFVMLNPSTADATVDDPTIRRCMGFARSWGYDGITVWNLYAFRATNPRELDSAEDPIGIGHANEDHLWAIVHDGRTDLIVAAWGAKPGHGRYANRELAMQFAFHDYEVHCLGTTKDGHPRHPLYVRGDTWPILWSPDCSCKVVGR